jgi:myo-inositol-1(or 4)-monophosphatase
MPADRLCEHSFVNDRTSAADDRAATLSKPVPAPSELLNLAERVAAEGAAIAVEQREQAITEVRTKSTDTDVVTAADHAVEDHIVGSLRAERPFDAILTEESGDLTPDNGRSSVRWILDPIDGTVNYLYGIPCYAVSLAAEVDGVVVAGVVRNAATGVTYTATLGGGAWRGGVRLAGSDANELGQSLVATGFGYDAARRAHQARVLAGLLASIRDIRRMGAGALDLCFAAEGSVDAYYEKGLNLWDLAAGSLIAREAGLTVTQEGGDRGLLIAAPPGIHGALSAVLTDLDAVGGP